MLILYVATTTRRIASCSRGGAMLPHRFNASHSVSIYSVSSRGGYSRREHAIDGVTGGGGSPVKYVVHSPLPCCNTWTHAFSQPKLEPLSSNTPPPPTLFVGKNTKKRKKRKQSLKQKMQPNGGNKMRTSPEQHASLRNKNHESQGINKKVKKKHEEYQKI